MFKFVHSSTKILDYQGKRIVGYLNNLCMNSYNVEFVNNAWQHLDTLPKDSASNDLMLIFASRSLLANNGWMDVLREKAPNCIMVCCSTAGEINRNLINEDSANCSLLRFNHTKVEAQIDNIANHANSFELGKSLSQKINKENLKHILIFADGQVVNSDELLSGLQVEVKENVLMSGGVAGDGDKFTETLVGLNNNIQSGNVVLVGLYGNHVKIGTSHHGGWDIFGVEKMITKSEGNVLHEIDQESALDLYKKYLGPYADQLPSSALLFPISIKSDDNDSYIVRTILSIDEKNKTMTFAGNVPEGSKIRFMKSNVDRLIQAASQAGEDVVKIMKEEKAKTSFALLVSCVGRRLAMDTRAEEEVEAAIASFSDEVQIGGFFSYGEIAPNRRNGISYLHNQTMTITTIGELPE
jgi:hypothetical protein